MPTRLTRRAFAALAAAAFATPHVRRAGAGEPIELRC